MKCPVDNSDLQMAARDGVEIDYCPKCRGVWLDRGELDKIVDRAMDEIMGPPPGNPGGAGYGGSPDGPGYGGSDGPGRYRDDGPRQGGGPRYRDDGYPPEQGGRWNSGQDRGDYDPRGGDPRDMDPRSGRYGPGPSDGPQGPGGPGGGRQRSILDIFNI